MGYTTNQRMTFGLLLTASTLAVLWMVTVDVADVWIVAYAALLPIAFRLLILASAEADPARLWRSAQVWRAMRRGEIVLYYQPKISLETGEPYGVEALARWEHPRRGTLLPGDWLDATSHRWLQRRFCLYVLDRAIAQAAEWRTAGRDFMVCVNVAPCCFVRRGLPRWISRLIARHELPPGHLCVELTEEALDISAASVSVADELSRLGIVLALDDFGIGHSSMDRLVGLSLNELKIDKRFVSAMVTNPRHGAVVRAAVSLGHSLGMVVVAEGVESQEVMRSLELLGCDMAQGFLFSPALTTTDLDLWLDRRRRITHDRAATSCQSLR
jgi:EAL domain-containing protein (putative c-di-GMP-specific phosphodiesterase class I)